MFEKRLKILLGFLTVALVVMVGRLVDLQVVRGAYYQARTARALLLKPHSLPFVRGAIFDRTGKVLVRDEPCWNLTIDYGVLAADAEDQPSDLRMLIRRYRDRYGKNRTEEKRERLFRQDLAMMWSRMAGEFSTEWSPLTAEDLRHRARRIHKRIQRIRQAVSQRRGFDTPIAEEKTAQTIIAGLNAEEQIAVREQFADYPWVHVEPSSKRAFAPRATSLAHVLGRTGRVSAAVVRNDPRAGDVFARYHADERVGVSGVEYAAEGVLRGRRGQITRDRQGQVVGEIIEAQHGGDVTLSIDAALQQTLYSMLGETLRTRPESSGGAMVVLDVASREVLALVSYPTYDPNRFASLYQTLRNDMEHNPLRFRAVANRYAPGSIIKPLACMAGLVSGKITLDTRENCTGYLFPEHRDRWRCWRVHGQSIRKAHGLVNVTQALTGSCNIFMYRLGERVGVDGLCSVFDMAGLGRRTGIGLREENAGINPTPAWLVNRKGTPVTRGHARLFAIGQGEISMTPLQVANLMATYANGRFRPVTLIRQKKKKPQWRLPGTKEQWLAIRRGIYGVVNDPQGTAYQYAHYEGDDYVLCGKTGSATASRWPTAYSIRYVDHDGREQVATVPAGTRKAAIARFLSQHPHATFDPAKVEVARRWPLHPHGDDGAYSHAWFGGFLQPVGPDHQPDWSKEPPVAFAVLVEFGGSGGRTCGPLARAAAAILAARYPLPPTTEQVSFYDTNP